MKNLLIYFEPKINVLKSLKGAGVLKTFPEI